MQDQHDNFYVVTGGPGSGKTTLLDALQQRGYAVVPEVARQIIIEQMGSGGKAVPWDDQLSYLEIMFRRSVEAYKKHRTQTDTLLFDRSILDAICYAKIIEAAVPQAYIEAAHQYRYHTKVFILPPWKDIYTTDDERKQTWAEAVTTYNMLADIYRLYNYQLIEIPLQPIEERVKYVEDFIHSSSKRI